MSRTKDVNGKESAKRRQGGILLGIAIAMGVLHFLVGIVMAFRGIEYTYDFPMEIWWTFMGTGGSLIGITIFEKPKE